jgi:HAD superfamily hydrolase (TIGR01484 family)
LLNSQTELSERNRAAIEKCLAQNIPVIIATSRAKRTVYRLIGDELASKCSLVMLNGALAIGKPPLNGYLKEILPEKTLGNIIDTALKYDPHTRITIEIEGYEFGTNGSLDKEVLWQRNSATPDMVISVEEAIKRSPCKIALGNTDIFPLAEILETQFGKVLSIIGAKFISTLANPVLNITTKTATKPKALHSLLAPRGILLNNTLAFGDDLPDLEMLQACGIAVTMANAFQEIKTVCSYQTASNDEDGVAIVLEKMLRQASR